jgi:hypothetical protein
MGDDNALDDRGSSCLPRQVLYQDGTAEPRQGFLNGGERSYGVRSRGLGESRHRRFWTLTRLARSRETQSTCFPSGWLAVPLSCPCLRRKELVALTRAGIKPRRRIEGSAGMWRRWQPSP